MTLPALSILGGGDTIDGIGCSTAARFLGMFSRNNSSRRAPVDADRPSMQADVATEMPFGTQEDGAGNGAIRLFGGEQPSRTATYRLFKLKDRAAERYEGISGVSLVAHLHTRQPDLFAKS